MPRILLHILSDWGSTNWRMLLTLLFDILVYDAVINGFVISRKLHFVVIF